MRSNGPGSDGSPPSLRRPNVVQPRPESVRIPPATPAVARYVPGMTAKDTVLALHAAYMTGDAERITALLHPDVIWVAPAGNATQVALGLGAAEDAGPPRGRNDLDRAAIVSFMVNDFPRFFIDASFDRRAAIAEGDTVLVEHRMTAQLPNGRSYINDYCFVYQVTDGKVSSIREYMDTRGGWIQAFGVEAPYTMIAGTPATR